MSETLAVRMLNRMYLSDTRNYLREPQLLRGPCRPWWLKLIAMRYKPPYSHYAAQFEVSLSTLFVTPGSPVLQLSPVLAAWSRIKHVPYRHGSWADDNFYHGFAFNYPKAPADVPHTG